MKNTEIRKLHGFFENELKNQILSFWMPRCEDKTFGGFLNCFDNKGEHLASYDKYTWSQGRFVWMFAKLAGSEGLMLTAAERAEFLRLAAQGADFLMEHCLIGEEDYRCVFLMNRDGSPKKVGDYEALDMSIYADCFVVIGLSRYALTSGDKKAYEFAKKLHASCVSRMKSGNFNTLPYPVSKKFRAHGIPMIMSNTTKELCLAADALDGDYGAYLRTLVHGYTEDILTNFVDENNVLHEFILSETNEFFPEILCQHMNPGHTIEDMWFAYEAAELCGETKWNEKIAAVAKKAIENGWDEEFGGILHFSGVAGGEPVGDATGVENEPMTLLLSDWGSKLWWVHSEALYTSLLCYFNTDDKDFLAWFEKIFDYTFATFPGKNPEVREWLQIRTRDGAPQDKVVALPVKDPFHITRNLVMLLELLSEKMK